MTFRFFSSPHVYHQLPLCKGTFSLGSEGPSLCQLGWMHTQKKWYNSARAGFDPRGESLAHCFVEKDPRKILQGFVQVFRYSRGIPSWDLYLHIVVFLSVCLFYIFINLLTTYLRIGSFPQVGKSCSLYLITRKCAVSILKAICHGANASLYCEGRQQISFWSAMRSTPAWCLRCWGILITWADCCKSFFKLSSLLDDQR